MAQNIFRRLPVIGNQIFRAGQVVEIWSQPCQPDPTIMVKAFFANVPMLVWSLIKPDPVDYLADRFGKIHKRRRKNRFKIGDVMIGDPGQGNGHLRWASFRGTQLLQKVGWYFAVIDATNDFLVNWSSMAFRYSGCSEPISGYATTTDDNGFEFLSIGNEMGCSGGTPSFSPGFVADTDSVDMLLPGSNSIAMNIGFTNRAVGANGYVTGVKLRAHHGATPTDLAIDLTPSNHGNTRTGSFYRPDFNTAALPVSYSIWIDSTPGWIKVSNWSLSLSGFPIQQGLAPDP